MSKVYKPNGKREKLRRWTQIQNGQLKEENGLIPRKGDNRPTKKGKLNA